MSERKQWFCTDCGDTFRAEKLDRCPMCYGARVIGPVSDKTQPDGDVGEVPK